MWHGDRLAPHGAGRSTLGLEMATDEEVCLTGDGAETLRALVPKLEQVAGHEWRAKATMPNLGIV